VTLSPIDAGEAAEVDAASAADPSAESEPGTARAPHAFQVHLDVFEGPFDLLLGLIAKHQLDVTEVALSKVTDEFLSFINVRGKEWDLGQATEFLVVAATLLDLKAARLLPSADLEDDEDLALLEARDLLFARLLQYRAYKEAAAVLAARMADEGRRFPRAVGLEERFAGLLPEVLLGLGPAEFAALAQRVLTPRPTPVVMLDHLHAPRVSVREQAEWLIDQLRRIRVATFRGLTADCTDTLTVVARFLGLLELYRDNAVAFEQIDPLGELHVRWTGTEEGEVELSDEFDVDDDSDGADEGHGADEHPERPVDAHDPASAQPTDSDGVGAPLEASTEASTEEEAPA
jgi:segregation and condensation protein A